MPVFDTVLWDWNGTLLDDAALCCELLNTMLARHGYAPVGSMEAYRQVFCFPIETYYRRAGFDFSRHPFAALADEYMRLYTPRSLGCPLQPDACAVLDALRAQGMRQVMLSASKQENLQQQVEHFGCVPVSTRCWACRTSMPKAKRKWACAGCGKAARTRPAS